MSLELIIRSPDARYDSATIKVERNITVKELKSKICDLYEDRPSQERQRIIVSGKLLKNEEILDKLFSSELAQHTIHVVFSNPTKIGTSATNSSGNSFVKDDAKLEEAKEEYRRYLLEFYRNNLPNAPANLCFPNMGYPVGHFPMQAQQPLAETDNEQPHETLWTRFSRRFFALFYIQNAPAEGFDEDGRPPRRDILDLIYVCFRLILLMVLINQAPSYKAFLLFSFILLFLLCRFVNQMGLFGNRRRIVHPAPPAPVENSAAPSNADESVVNGQQPAQINNSLFDLVRRSFGTIFIFFTSLFPEEIQQMVE